MTASAWSKGHEPKVSSGPRRSELGPGSAVRRAGRQLTIFSSARAEQGDRCGLRMAAHTDARGGTGRRVSPQRPKQGQLDGGTAYSASCPSDQIPGHRRRGGSRRRLSWHGARNVWWGGVVDAVGLARSFGLGGAARLSDGPVARGKQGLVWRLDTAEGSWAVKVPFHQSDKDEVRSATAFQEAGYAAGVPAPQVRRTTEGCVFAMLEGRQVRMYEWVDLRDAHRAARAHHRNRCHRLADAQSPLARADRLRRVGRRGSRGTAHS